MSLELRNRIYQHIAQSTTRPTSLSTIICMTPPPYSLPHFRRSPAYAFLWSEFRRQSLGLTQVCRLLREEFLPLHHSSIAIEVYPTHLDRYMWDFFSNGETCGIIYLPMYDEGIVQILPLLRLRARSPHLDLRFDCEEVEDWVMLRNLVDVEHRTIWAEYALRCAAQVHYHIPSGMLVIQVCEYVRERWMKMGVSSVDELESDYYDAKLDWCRRVGLQDFVAVDHVRVSG
ncbi:hypothetical protein BKA63DRAFT_501578 [Paraphoma chrysanthemicola]|nr:hypothetical protein BKA63DRAFT_501578 [Paraphoma chrysanthemicola]